MYVCFSNKPMIFVVDTKTFTHTHSHAHTIDQSIMSYYDKYFITIYECVHNALCYWEARGIFLTVCQSRVCVCIHMTLPAV